uniref:Uncharacterized protein n=1 Tax=Amorphochlora amoebiformis TaxID=1561963 RepID=A0A0H5BR12_9EUKA|nr:hypothetical protein [Amorphochlora amoebiformis]
MSIKGLGISGHKSSVLLQEGNKTKIIKGKNKISTKIYKFNPIINSKWIILLINSIKYFHDTSLSKIRFLIVLSVSHRYLFKFKNFNEAISPINRVEKILNKTFVNSHIQKRFYRIKRI